MNLANAKAQWTAKKEELAEIKRSFTDIDNQKEIQKVIDDLSPANIEDKIVDNTNGKFDNAEQNGNRYLIAARIAE